MIRVWKTTLKLRMIIGFMVILIFAVLLIFRAFDVQIIEGGRLSKLADAQFQASVYFMPERGNIYSSDGGILAASVNIPGVAVDPLMVKDKLASAEKLSKATGLKYEKIIKVLTKNLQFAWIQRRVSAEAAKKVEKLGIEGVIIVKQPVRYYPNGTLLAHTLGFVGINDNGLSGIEYKYNKYLKGNKRALKVLQDGLGQYIFIRGFGLKKATHGDNIYLTINKQLQFITQYYLDKEAKAADSKGAFAILMDPNTGAILAMADYPAFNPNYYWKYPARYWRNRAVTDDFEPGSTMKPFIISGALQDGIIKPDTIINGHHGAYYIDGITVHDVEDWFGKLTINQLIEYSCNVCACQVGMKMGKERVWHWLKRWGLRSVPHAGLLGENAGIDRNVSKWSEVGPCEEAFGQGAAINGLQEITALSAIANGGFLLKPYIIKKIVNPYGKVIFRAKPHEMRRVINSKTDKEIKYMMRLVVKGGTGQYAKLIDFRVSGKTGTGQVDNPKTGTYFKNKYTASFMAFVPYKHPVLAMLVVQQEPSKISYYGGAVSAPVVRDVFKTALNILNVYPGGKAYKKQLKAGNAYNGNNKLKKITENLKNKSFKNKKYTASYSETMPDLKGDTIYEALNALSKFRRLSIKIWGSGYLYYQSIKHGTFVSADGGVNSITLKFKPQGYGYAALRKTEKKNQSKSVLKPKKKSLTAVPALKLSKKVKK
ncbi:MAG: penicillin-binding transpeptidase domain-containing protein [Deltaproteobacteria bacterium]|nr:penicillin-binding transpeptidase domain-containing protein [Deltaproteobacteria bacterium]